MDVKKLATFFLIVAALAGCADSSKWREILVEILKPATPPTAANPVTEASPVLSNEPVSHTTKIKKPKIQCFSANSGDDLLPQIGNAEPLTLKVPVARFREEGKGKSVVLLPSSEKSMRFFWTTTEALAAKQTVLSIQPPLLDLSPMHRLLYTPSQNKIIQFVVLPVEVWQKGIKIQPVLEPLESRWGRIETYPVRVGLAGFIHPFSGIERQLSGESLSPHLRKTIDQIVPGSIYIPNAFASQTGLEKPVRFENFCPVAGGSA